MLLDRTYINEDQHLVLKNEGMMAESYVLDWPEPVSGAESARKVQTHTCTRLPLPAPLPSAACMPLQLLPAS